jgi:peptidyl-prolyl cis-trans isomerase C
MTKRFSVLMSILFFFLFLLFGCEKSKEKGLGAKDLVRVNNTTISLDDFNQISERLSLEGKMKLVNEKGMRDFLDNYVINREVLYQEGKKRGFDKNKEIAEKVEEFKRAMVIDALLQEVMKDKGDVSEGEVRKYYKENEERFTEPKEVKIRHIFVTSEPALKEVLMKLSQGENFAKLAAAYNADKSREDGGSLGWIRRGQLSTSFAPFEEAAFSLRKKDEISEVVKTPYGYHLVQLEDRRGNFLRPFDQVKEKIQAFLQSEKRQAAYLQFVKETRSKAKVIVNEKLWADEEKKDLKPRDEKPKQEKPKGEKPKEERPKNEAPQKEKE